MNLPAIQLIDGFNRRIDYLHISVTDRCDALRSVGSKSDPYAVFEKMLGRGNPPDDWGTLIAAVRRD